MPQFHLSPAHSAEMSDLTSAVHCLYALRNQIQTYLETPSQNPMALKIALQEADEVLKAFGL